MEMEMVSSSIQVCARLHGWAGRPGTLVVESPFATQGKVIPTLRRRRDARQAILPSRRN